MKNILLCLLLALFALLGRLQAQTVPTLPFSAKPFVGLSTNRTWEIKPAVQTATFMAGLTFNLAPGATFDVMPLQINYGTGGKPSYGYGVAARYTFNNAVDLSTFGIDWADLWNNPPNLPQIPGTSRAFLALDSLPLHTVDSFVVSYCSDGDNVHGKRFKTPKGAPLEFRFEGMDAPNSGAYPFSSVKQDYWKNSKDSLNQWLRGKKIVFQSYGMSYNRVLIRAMANGEDVALHAIKRGWAWHYEKNDLPGAVNDDYRRAEKYAKRKKLGLHAKDAHPNSKSAMRPVKWSAKQKEK